MAADRWLAERRSLNQRRHQLAAAACGLYPETPRAADSWLLCRPQWLPARPIDLDQVRLRWSEPAPAPAVTGAGPASAHLRPVAPGGRRYPSYADAMAAADRSTLTLRRFPGGGAAFPLHWRDPAKVGHAGGLCQVTPVGVFQPIGDSAESEQADLSLWRAIVREFSEELLGWPPARLSSSSPGLTGRNCSPDRAGKA